ncbi:MAG: tetratricopeptide repeat protein [Alphaproteobacteria bacterium]|nr:tetratricopeptide repeat protein [Alphaproteobacteria bacterium]
MVTSADAPGGPPPIDPNAARLAVAGLSESFARADYPQAETYARLLLRLVPADANLRRILAAAVVAQGKFEPGIVELRRALFIQPNYVEAQYNLANTRLEMDETLDAVRHYRRALVLAPDHGEALINLGNARAGRGEVDLARDVFQRARILQPDQALALGNLGALAIGHGGAGEALVHFKRVYQAAPKAVGAALNLANAYRDRGRPGDALAYYRQALEIAPDDVVVLVNAAEALGRLDVRTVAGNPDAARAVIAACLASGVVESNIVNIASQALLTRDLSHWLDPDATPLEAAALSELMSASEGLLACHLMDSLITDPDLEGLLTEARRILLCRYADAHAHAHAQAGSPANDLELARGIAYQGVLNEYLWAVGEDEERLLDALAARLTAAAAGAGKIDPMGLYLLAAYRPLATIEPIRRWAAVDRDRAGAMAGDLDFLILDRVREQSIAAGIPDLTSVDDTVSVLVQAQYETNPYPRWNSLARFEPIDPVEQVLNEIAPNRPVLRPLAERPAVLIAGCGTGRQPIQAAMTYRGASVLAIDLSLPSLAYAMRKAGDLGVDNISFARADILGLRDLPDRFELIECSGALHHMAEPEAGLRALLSVLAPGGLLNIAV